MIIVSLPEGDLLQSIAKVKGRHRSTVSGEAARRHGETKCYGRRSIRQEPASAGRVEPSSELQEGSMGFGRGALLWLLGVPLPIIILLAIFWGN
jgi:hypothetical protein